MSPIDFSRINKMRCGLSIHCEGPPVTIERLPGLCFGQYFSPEQVASSSTAHASFSRTMRESHAFCSFWVPGQGCFLLIFDHGIMCALFISDSTGQMGSCETR